MVKKRVRTEADGEEDEAKRMKVTEEPKKEENVKVEGENTAVCTEEAAARIKEQDKSTVKARVAVASLIKFVNARGDKSLFPEVDHGLSLLVTYKKPSLTNGPTQKKRILLPHPPLPAAKASFCIIMPDLDVSDQAKKDPDVDKQSREWEDRIEVEHGLTKKHIAKVMTKTQLAREYKSFNDKRKLASAYDVFLVEKRVHKIVHSLLGKEFIKQHKMPLTFDYSSPLCKTLDKAAATSIYDLSANRLRVSVASGHLAQPLVDVVGNIEHVIDQVIANCPGGFANIRSLFVQLRSSQPSLPIYEDDSSAKDVVLPSEPKKRKEDKEIAGELSTLPEGLSVSVSKNGRVRVIKDETGEGVLYPTTADEWSKKDGLRPRIDLLKMAKKKNAKVGRSLAKKKDALKKGEAAKRAKTFTAIGRPVLKGVKKEENGGKKERRDRRKVKGGEGNGEENQLKKGISKRRLNSKMKKNKKVKVE